MLRIIGDPDAIVRRDYPALAGNINTHTAFAGEMELHKRV